MHDAPCPFTTQRKMARDMRKIMRLVAIVLTAYIASNGCVVNGRSIHSEDVELEKELAAINKPSIKTIEVRLCFYVFRVLKNFTKTIFFFFPINYYIVLFFGDHRQSMETYMTVWT